MIHFYPRLGRYLASAATAGALLLGLTLTATAQWVEQNTNFPNPLTGAQQVQVVDANNVWITAYDGSVAAAQLNDFSRTTDGGASWTAGTVSPAAGLGFSQISALSGNTAWAAMINSTSSGGQLYRTTNGGASWTRQLATGFPAASGGYLNAVQMFASGSGVVMGDPLTTTNEFEVYTTTNGGVAWTPVPAANLPDPQTSEYGYQRVMCSQGTQNVWFGTSTGRVFRSTNGGTSWTAATTGLAEITRLAFSSATDGLAMQVTAAGALVGVRRTTNGGATWTTPASTGTIYTADLKPVPGTANAYLTAGAIATGRGIGYTTDGGTTWTDLENGTERTAIGAASAAAIWAGTRTNATTGLGGVAKGSAVTTPPPAGLNWAWARTMSGAGNDAVRSMAPDAAGNVYVTGIYQNTITLGTNTFTSRGGTDIFVAKYSAAGTLLWARTAGGLSDDISNGIAVDPTTGEVVITGGITFQAIFDGTTITGVSGGYDIFVAKYSATGAVRWVRPILGSGVDYGRRLAIDASGDIYVTGQFEDVLIADANATVLASSAGGTDGFLMALSSVGGIRWTRSIGGSLADIGAGVAVNSALGLVYFTGRFQGTAYIDGVTLNSAGDNDFFLAAYPISGGTMQWARRLGSTGDDGANSVSVDAAGNAYTASYFTGTITAGSQTLTSTGGSADVLVTKYNSAGTIQWARAGGGPNIDSGFNLAVSAAGTVAVTGFFNTSATFGGNALTAAGGDDVLLLRYTSAGVLQAADQVGGTGNDAGRAIAYDATGNLLLGGQFSAGIDFNTAGAFASVGGTDGFIAKLGSSCTLTAPTVSVGPACVGQTLTLTATGIAPNTTLAWTGPNGFTATTATATVPNAPAAASGTYTLTVTSAAQGCTVSASTTATVGAVPATPTVPAIFFKTCGPGSVALSVDNVPGLTYAWYTTATGGTSIAGATDASYTTPSISVSTTYYVSAVGVGGCESPRTSINAAVFVVPTAGITASGQTTFCAGGSVTLNAVSAAPAPFYAWFLNGQPIAGAFSSTYMATTAGNYTVRVTANYGCDVLTAPVAVTVTPAASAAFAYPAAAFCLGGANVAPLISGTTGGTFSVSPATGLNFNTATGVITLAGSVAGPYAISYAVGGAGTCAAISSQIVTLTAAPTATFAYSLASYCTGSAASAVPTLALGATAGTFSAPAGLLINATTGAIDLILSAPGQYTVLNSVAVSGSCPAALATAAVSIAATPAVPTITPALLGGLIQLTSSAATGNQWYLNGAPVAGATGTTYTVTAAAQNGTYTVVSTAGGCVSAASAGQTIAVTGVADDAAAAAALQIAPNPTADGRVTLTLAPAASATPLTVFDGTGRVVLRAVLPTGATRYALDARHLPPGVYTVRVGAGVRRMVRE